MTQQLAIFVIEILDIITTQITTCNCMISLNACVWVDFRISDAVARKLLPAKHANIGGSFLPEKMLLRRMF